MSIRKINSLLALSFALVFALFMFGCAVPQASDGQTTADSSRQYMADVNQAVEKLSDQLNGFQDAVSREDAVTMRTQADNAFQTLDELAAIEAPAELDELKKSYVKGADQLKDALNDYIDLYTEIAAATDAHPFDYATYDERLKKIQEAYDEGVKTLEDADKSATEL